MSTQPDEAPKPISCPRCGKRMAKTTVGVTSGAGKGATKGAIEVDQCMSCGGLWLDVFEREQLAADKGAVSGLEGSGPFTAAPPVRSPMACPRDNSRLILMCDPNQPHVKFESCKICGGSFLERGEMTDLASFTLMERIRHGLGLNG